MANHTRPLQQWLEKIWYDPSKANSLSRKLLTPLSYAYSGINKLQRKIQTKKLPQLACPVIVVGNISVGGTGKTPLTIHIINLLKQAGYHPAIITRGYGGKATSWPQAVSSQSDPYLVGDEAVQMASSTGVPVYAGANRLESIDLLLKQHSCDVIVSDDGMQHYKLPRDIEIAVIDGKRQLGNGKCLPAGPLREPPERLKTCDFIVMNNSTMAINNSDETRYFEMALKGKTLINLSTLETKPLSDLKGETIQALTGIGNPQRFYNSLTDEGIKVIENTYPDHYAFEAFDLNFDEASTVIMTEKDAVKCKPLLDNKPESSKQYWCLPVTATLPNEFNIALLTKLKEVLKEVKENQNLPQNDTEGTEKNF